MGQTQFEPVPVATYGVVLLLSAVAFTILVRAILACQPPESLLALAIGTDVKAKSRLSASPHPPAVDE
jgi:hypothetical protein